MFKKLAQQLKLQNDIASKATKPFSEVFLTPKNVFLKRISQHALELYEKQAVINNFAKLVLSDPENTSHVDLVNELFDRGVADPFVDEKLDILADNQKFLRDLGLL